MLNFTRESTHYLIIANVWIATSILSYHTHDTYFAAGLGIFWFLYGVWMNKKERSE